MFLSSFVKRLERWFWRSWVLSQLSFSWSVQKLFLFFRLRVRSELTISLLFWFLLDFLQNKCVDLLYIAVTFIVFVFSNSGLLWQDRPQHHKTWYTTPTRPRWTLSGAPQLTQGVVTTSHTGLDVDAAAGSQRNVYRVGPLWAFLQPRRD